MSADDWQVYIIEADDGRLYTGVTTDVQRRFAEHLAGGLRGAKFFRGRRPSRIVFVESGHDRSSAHQREAAIKKLSRRRKLQLIAVSQGSSVLRPDQ